MIKVIAKYKDKALKILTYGEYKSLIARLSKEQIVEDYQFIMFSSMDMKDLMKLCEVGDPVYFRSYFDDTDLPA